MVRRRTDFFQVAPCLLRRFRIVDGNVVKTDDGVHRCTDFMAHIGEKCGFRPVCLFCRLQRIAERLLLLERFAGLGVHIGKTCADCVHNMVFAFIRMPDAGKLHDLPRLTPVHADHIAIGDDQVFFQSFANRIRLNELQEFFPVGFHHILVAVRRDSLQIGEAFPCFKAGQVGALLITDAAVFIQFQIVNTPVIGGQRPDHPVLLLPLLLL